MSTPYGMARTVSSGGRGVAWLFFVPIALVSIYVIDAMVVWRGHEAGLDEAGSDLAVVLCFLTIWYFGIGRIPNLVAVRKIRRQAADAVLTYGVDVFTHPKGSRRSVARFAGAIPNVVSVSRLGLQLWAGTGDSARPVKSWGWGEVSEVSAPGSSLIAVQTYGSSIPFELSVLENRALSTLRVRGKSRVRLVAQLDELREFANQPSRGTH
jgi:hypothetical protein